MYHVRIESSVDGRVIETDLDALMIVVINRNGGGVAMPERIEFLGLTVEEARLIASFIPDQTMRAPDYFREL